MEHATTSKEYNQSTKYKAKKRVATFASGKSIIPTKKLKPTNKKLNNEKNQIQENSLKKTSKSKENEDKEKVPNVSKFEPIFTSGKESVKIKPCIESIKDPTFLNAAYCVQPVTTENTLTIDILDLNPLINRQDVKKSTITFDFYICLVHKLSKERNIDCEYCCLFQEFTYTYILKTRYHYLTFPPPIWYTPKVFNFLKPFCDNAYKNAIVKKYIKKAKDKELESYAKFINMDFADGSLYSLSTSKTSYIRNYILGFPTSGVRATLTIDASLPPHYAILPQWLYDQICMACPLAIINRAPSINTTCIYTVELLRNSNPLDFTVIINPYVAPLMNADQDGDELSIFYLRHPNVRAPTHEIFMGIAELKRFSWKYGTRCDLMNKPRYEVAQYLKYIVHRYDDYFVKNNKLYASLKGSSKVKLDLLMHLGTSTHPKEVDEFILLLSDFVKYLDVQLPSIEDLINGTGAIFDVIQSGAKGEALHLETYLKQLFTWDENRTEQLKKNFDNYISSGAEMSSNGAYQFLLLGAVNPIFILNNNLYYNDEVLLENISKFTGFASILYNSKACYYAFNSIAYHKANVLVTEEEVETYLKTLQP